MPERASKIQDNDCRVVEHTEDCPGPRDVCTCGGYVPLSVAENLATAIDDVIVSLGLLRGYVDGDGWKLLNDSQREAMQALAGYRAAYPREETE